MAQEFSVDRITPESSQQDVEAYHQFVDASTQGILYCKTWWLETTAPGRWEVLVVRKGDGLRAAWPLVYAPDGKTVTTPPLTQKLGIIFGPTSSQKYAESLSEEFRLAQALLDAFPAGCRLAQPFHEEFLNWIPLYWAGFQQTTRYTYLIEDLSDLAAIWDGMRPRVRTPIRNAEKSGIVAEETTDVELLYSINDRSFVRQGKQCPYSLTLLADLIGACQQNAGARMLLAKDSQERIHACDLLVYDPRCAVSIVQGADPDLRKSGAQALLDWRSIEFANTVSQKFDFEGSMIESVEPYNRAFGAVQRPYFFIYGKIRPKQASRLAQLRRRAGSALRKLGELVEP